MRYSFNQSFSAHFKLQCFEPGQNTTDNATAKQVRFTILLSNKLVTKKCEYIF
jgi:hypothetical protein